jgi:hypothetical protein
MRKINAYEILHIYDHTGYVCTILRWRVNSSICLMKGCKVSCHTDNILHHIGVKLHYLGVMLHHLRVMLH